MIHIIKYLLSIPFYTLILFSCIMLSCILWDKRYIELANKCELFIKGK